MTAKSKARGRAPQGSVRILVAAIVPNPEQPRKTFDEAGLRGLAQSIEENDLIQPIVVEGPVGPGGARYVLIDGERRLRAVKLLGWPQIDAVIRPATDPDKGQERLAKALVANVQRADLDPIEQARALQILVNDTGSITDVARQTGLGQGVLHARLALLNLSPVLQKMYQQRLIPLENNLVHKFKKLAHADQERIASIGVTRGGTIRTFTRLLNKELEAKPEKKSQAGKSKRKQTPWERKVEVEVMVEPGMHFDALALVRDWRKLPKEVVGLAQQSCKACELYEMASHETCRRCALPDFLVRYQMMMNEKKGDAR